MVEVPHTDPGPPVVRLDVEIPIVKRRMTDHVFRKGVVVLLKLGDLQQVVIAPETNVSTYSVSTFSKSAQGCQKCCTVDVKQ